MSKRNSRRLLCLLLCLMLPLVTGCTTGEVDGQRDVPVSTLAPARAGLIPKGTQGLTWEADVSLFLPSLDGTRLLAVNRRMTLDRGSLNARTIVEALLSDWGDDRTRSLGGEVSLGLYGSNPVEVSAGICTVNMSASALMLSQKELYTLALSLAATLALQEDISGVNLLICDRPAGYDIAGYLPAGTVTAHPGEDLTALWELLDARKTALGEKASEKSLSATATLYYPLADGSGVMP